MKRKHAIMNSISHRLFWTDFEEPTFVWANTYSTIQRKDRPSSGVNSKGYSWPPTRFASDCYVQNLSNGVTLNDGNFANYFVRGIVTAGTGANPSVGHGGSGTKKMFHQQLQRPVGEDQFYNGPAGNQLQQVLFMRPKAEFAKDRILYQRSWHYLPANLFTVNIPNDEQPPGSGWFMFWRNLWAYKTGGAPLPSDQGDRRGYVRVGNGDGHGQHWAGALDQNANSGLPDVTLYMGNTSGVTPLAGVWFKLEVLLKHSSSGFFRAAINGSLVASYVGSLLGVNGQGIDRFFASACYFGGHYPSSQWCDELEIWADALPTDATIALP